MFTPPSGRLMRRTIFAAVPVSKRSEAPGFVVSSDFVMMSPIKLSAAMAFSTVSASCGVGSITGVKMPGKIGFPRRGMTKRRAGSIWSAGTIMWSLIHFSPVFRKGYE